MTRTVFDYFTEKLGFEPYELTLNELGIDTPCGKGCVESIDKFATLLTHVDPHPSVTEPLIQSANAQVEVLWLG
jgi:hypothetical protein